MTARWYIVHAYSNFEKKVAEDIENKAKQKGLSGRIEQIVVPTEKVVEVRRGKKVDAERKFFPGYVLMKAELNDAVTAGLPSARESAHAAISRTLASASCPSAATSAGDAAGEP